MADTHIPAALLQRADLLASEAYQVSKRRINWRGRERELQGYGLTGGSSADRVAIVHFMACLERRRLETGSLS